MIDPHNATIYQNFIYETMLKPYTPSIVVKTNPLVTIAASQRLVRGRIITMHQYKPWLLTAIFLLILGATSPSGADKDLIIKLQGEVLVLQRQLRDLQESFDKWQGQSTQSLQKISDNTNSTAREISTIGDSLKTVQSSQTANLTGATTQLQKISEQLARHNQNFSSISQQITSLRESIQEYQQRSERERSEKSLDPSLLINNPDNLFAAGSAQFKKGNYESAIIYFKTYLESHNQTPESDDALFGIAESYFSLGKYNEALREYDRLLSEYPRGDRTLQASLKKGITLLHLERRSEGVDLLRSVIAQAPNSQEASLAKDELNRLGEATSSSSSLSPSTPPQNRQRPL